MSVLWEESLKAGILVNLEVYVFYGSCGRVIWLLNPEGKMNTQE